MTDNGFTITTKRERVKSPGYEHRGGQGKVFNPNRKLPKLRITVTLNASGRTRSRFIQRNASKKVRDENVAAMQRQLITEESRNEAQP